MSKVKRRTCLLMCVPPSTTLDRITDAPERQPAAALGDGTWADDVRQIPLFPLLSVPACPVEFRRRCVVVYGIWMISREKRLAQLENLSGHLPTIKCSHKSHTVGSGFERKISKQINVTRRLSRLPDRASGLESSHKSGAREIRPTILPRYPAKQAINSAPLLCCNSPGSFP